MTPPPVSETAAWTPEDEESLRIWSGIAAICESDALPQVARLALEILRLRAENERLRHSSTRRWNIEEDDETGTLLVCTTSRSRVSDNG